MQTLAVRVGAFFSHHTRVLAERGPSLTLALSHPQCVLALLVLSCHASLVLGTQRLRVSPRVAALAANLTLAQKIGFLHGYDGPYVGTIAGLASAGIPPLTMEDGPQGVADGVVHTTAWPSALTVAQTWNPELFAFFASQCAEEQRARGTGVMLGPMVNLARVPQGGRNFESLGEDPYLSSRLVEASIKGIQSQHVMANVKHFIDNNQVRKCRRGGGGGGCR